MICTTPIRGGNVIQLPSTLALQISKAGLIPGGYPLSCLIGLLVTQANYFASNGVGWTGNGITLPVVLDIEHQNRPDDAGLDADGYSKGGDTVGSIPQFSVVGGKKRRKGSSEVSGYSMSSLSMFRNAGLTMVDERFDRMCRFVD